MGAHKLSSILRMIVSLIDLLEGNFYSVKPIFSTTSFKRHGVIVLYLPGNAAGLREASSVRWPSEMQDGIEKKG